MRKCSICDKTALYVRPPEPRCAAHRAVITHANLERVKCIEAKSSAMEDQTAQFYKQLSKNHALGKRKAGQGGHR